MDVRDAKQKVCDEKLLILTNRKVEPLVNRTGKPMSMSKVTFTNKGNLIVKRAKKVVLDRAI
jgi:hypothetical protein